MIAPTPPVFPKRVRNAGVSVVVMTRYRSAQLADGGPYAGVDLTKPIVMGHEYVGEILDYGPGSRRQLKVGTNVTSVPVMRRGTRTGIVGYTSCVRRSFAVPCQTPISHRRCDP